MTERSGGGAADDGEPIEPQDPTDHPDHPADPADPADSGDLADDGGSHDRIEPAVEGTTADGPVEPVRRHHRRAAGVLIGVLLALLGFGIAVQVRSNSSSDSLSAARDDDLIRILDDQNSRADRLRQQIAALQTTEQQLQASGDRDSVALAQAQQQEQALRILLGTLAATGPGVTITITDPQRKLKAEDLLDVVEELRGAGAEAIQFGAVRVSSETAFIDTSNGVEADGTRITAPYVVLAIGDPQTLDTAMQIPGGVRATARAAGGDAVVSEQQTVTIDALRTLPTPSYAKTTGR